MKTEAEIRQYKRMADALLAGAHLLGNDDEIACMQGSSAAINWALGLLPEDPPGYDLASVEDMERALRVAGIELPKEDDHGDATL